MSPEQPGPGLSRAATSGAAWLMLGTVAGRVVQFAAQLALAALLLPADFGAVGLAYTIVNLAGAFVDFGVGDVLVQRGRRLRLWSAPAFWTSLGLSAAGSLVLLFVAPIAAAAYRADDLAGLVAVLAAAIPIGALSTVPTALLRRALRFRFLALYDACELAGLQLATIALAWAGHGPYSFVLPVPAFAAIRATVFWLKTRPAVQRAPRGREVRFLTGRGLTVCGKQIVLQAIAQGDYAVLGLLTTPAIVGIYFFAFRLAAQPVWLLAGSLQRVMMPALTQLDPIRQKQAAVRTAQLLAFLVMPLCFLQAALAPPLMRILFGARWSEAVPIVQILSVGLALDAAAWIAGALLNAQGQFRRAFRLACAFAPLFFGFVLTGAWLGEARGVAIGVALYYAIYTPAFSCLVFRGEIGGIAGFTRLFLLPPGLASLAMGGAYVVSCLPGLAGDALLRFVAVLALGPPAYAVAVWLVAPDILHEIVERLGLDRALPLPHQMRRPKA